MKEAFDKIKKAFANIRRVVKTDEDLEWNRAVYKCSTIVSEVEAEYEDNVCEWERIAINTYLNRTHAEIYSSRVLDWCACPYCGKKVKVVE